MKTILSLFFCFFIYSLFPLNVLSAVMEAPQDSPPTYSVATQRVNDFDCLKTEVQNLGRSLKHVEGRKAIVLVGPTGAGKSTLFAALTSENPLRIRTTERGPVFDSDHPGLISDLRSGTTVPNVKAAAPEAYNKWTIVDCPGIGSTEGPYADLLNGITLSQVLTAKRFEKFKIVMVLPESALSGRADEAIESFNNLARLFPNTPDIANMISCVITKTRDMTLPEAFGPAQELMTPAARTIVQRIVSQRRYASLPHPSSLKDTYGEMPATLPGNYKTDILTALKEAPFSSPTETHIVVSERSQPTVLQLGQRFREDISESCGSTVLTWVRDACQTLVAHHSGEVQRLRPEGSEQVLPLQAIEPLHVEGQRLQDLFSSLAAGLSEMNGVSPEEFGERLSGTLQSLQVAPDKWEPVMDKIASLLFLKGINPEVLAAATPWEAALRPTIDVLTSFGTAPRNTLSRERKVGAPTSEVAKTWHVYGNPRGGQILGVLPGLPQIRKQIWSTQQKMARDTQVTVTFPSETLTYPWAEVSTYSKEIFRGEK